MKIEKIAIAGGGIIGSSWAIVYARAGFDVALYDRNRNCREHLHSRVRDAIERCAALVGDFSQRDAVLFRIKPVDTLEAAAHDADFVHECIEEKRDSKQAIFRDLDRTARPNAILATSTSTFPISTFASDLPGRERCIVIHPATPPHLLPIVEICPAPFTKPEITDCCFSLMTDCGQVPVLIRKEIAGFVLNRMQTALVVEMLRCLDEDVISPADLDRIISDGFGLRWAFLGPFEGVDLNAAGGIREYLERFGFMFNEIAAVRGASEPVVTPRTIDILENYVRANIPIGHIQSRRQWRDECIAALRVLKSERVWPTAAGDLNEVGTVAGL